MNNIVLKNEVIENYDPNGYVYDICLDGTLVNAFGNNVVTQTDGFNFQTPPNEVIENTVYIGKGLNRNTINGKEYHGVDADIAEFSDLFLRGKMGLNLDEIASASINYSRKNYCDLLDDGTIKYVGNTIKSKRMPIYIENLIQDGIKMLLYNNGDEFLELYYDYIERIYNYKIPLKQIASKGKIKKSISEYKAYCKELTKAGRPKNRQVWYELVLNDGVEVDVGDTIYYINIGDGKKKSSYKDIEKKTIKNEDGTERIELINNCIMLDRATIDSDKDVFCSDEIEYNASKYVEQFNKRVKPLLVCFSKEIRDKILVLTPDKRSYFTKEQMVLTSGEPNKIEDQDTYEQLMTMEDKEIRFWTSVNETPPFIEETDMSWEEIKVDYFERMEILKKEEIKQEVELLDSIIDRLTQDDVDDFITELKIPKKIKEICTLDSKTMRFISKKHGVFIGNIYDIVDKEFLDDGDGEE